MFRIVLADAAAKQLEDLEAHRREALDGLCSLGERAEIEQALMALHRAIRAKATKLWLADGSKAAKVTLRKALDY